MDAMSVFAVILEATLSPCPDCGGEVSRRVVMGNKGSGTCVYVVVHMSGAERRVYYKTLGSAGLVGKDWTEVNDAGPCWDAVLQGDRRVAVIE